MDVADPNDPTTWVFQHFPSIWSADEPPPTSAGRLAHVKKFAEPFCEPFRSASLWLPDDTYIPNDSIKHWETPVAWDNHGGRITLAGDAAHAMSPYRGQGLNNALLDAANYVEALKKVLSSGHSSEAFAGALKQTIDVYDAEVLERGTREIKISAMQTRMTHFREEFLNSPMAQFGTAKFVEMKDHLGKAVPTS